MRRALFLPGLVALAFACQDDPVQQGEIVVTIQTDVALPESVDRIRLEVVAAGNLQFGNDFEVGRGKLTIPATLGLLEGKDPSTPVLVRLIARKDGKVKMLREAVTTIPSKRIAMLRMPIRWLCDDSAKETTPASVSNAKCAEGQTCIGGDCYGSDVDSSKLPDYKADDVFGPNGCFDVTTCMGGNTTVTMDPATCSFAKPADTTNLNVALRVANDGICDPSSTTCFVVLDKAPADPTLPLDGWRENGARIDLPKAVCTRIASGRVLAVVASSACAAKSASAPVCGAGGNGPGPANDAGTDTGVPDGGVSTPTPVAGGLLAGETIANTFLQPGNFTPFIAGGQLVYGVQDLNTGDKLYALHAAALGGGGAPARVELDSQLTKLGPLFFGSSLHFVSSVSGQLVRRDLLNGGTPTETFGAPTNVGLVAPNSTRSVAIDATRVYGGTTQSIFAVDRATGAVTTLAGSFPGAFSFNYIAADSEAAGYVYTVAYSTNTPQGNARIDRVQKTQTNGPHALVTDFAATQQKFVRELIVDGPNLYGTSSGPSGFDDARIFRVPVGGGAPTTIYANQADAFSLSLVNGQLYWVAGDGKGAAVRRKIFRGSAVGGTPELLFTSTTGEILFLAFAPTHGAKGRMYFATEDKNAPTVTAQLFYVDLL